MHSLAQLLVVVVSRGLLSLLYPDAALAQAAGGASRPPATCQEWHECQRLALDAADRKEYETFHDLAWRTVQTGPPRDPALMYVLARAQCLSGRPHDALIMLQRLAEMGVATDAETNDDFQATRALPGWPDVQAQIDRVGAASAAAPAAAPAVAPGGGARSGRAAAPKGRPAARTGGRANALEPAIPAPTAAAPAAAPAAVSPAPAPPAPGAAPVRPAPKALPTFKPERIEDVVHIAMPGFSPAGLAYDAVSARFVAGDLRGRRLFVVGDGADHPVDLVRADSAGFHDIAALEIDARRGDLWVATGTGDHDWVIHKLQLLSGRPLKSTKADAGLEPMNVIDLGVTPSGTVVALDAIGQRLLLLKPQSARLESAARVNLQDPTSVAATADDSVLYVAQRAGVSRVDLRTGTTALLAAPDGFDAGAIERIRSYGNSLIAVQRTADGSRRLLKIDLNSSGRSMTTVAVIEAALDAAGPTFATISGDELSYLVGTDGARSGSTDDDDRGSKGVAAFIVRRVRLP